MHVVRLTSPAIRDLDQIADHISADNPPAALEWLESTESLFELLAKQPELGERRSTRQLKDARRCVHGNYIVYYRPIQTGVEILRVVHGARDQGRLI